MTPFRAAILEEATERLVSSVAFAELKKRRGQIVRLPVPAAAWVFEKLADELGRRLFVIVAHESEAYAWLEASRFFTPERGAVYFSAPALSPYHEVDVSLAVRADESAALDTIARGGAKTVLTTARALFRRLPTIAEYRAALLCLRPGDEVAPADVLEHLLAWGYHRADLVVEVGQVALRGGVFDVFPPGEHQPLRLDFFGDTIESIRSFEPESQRSNESCGEAILRPLALFAQGPAQARRLADTLQNLHGREAGAEIAERIARLRVEGRFEGWEHYLPLLHGQTIGLEGWLEQPLIVTLDHAALLEEASHHAENLESERTLRQGQGRLHAPPAALEIEIENVASTIGRAEYRLGDLLIDHRDAIDFAASSTDLLFDQLPLLSREVELAQTRGDRFGLIVPAEHRAKMKELLEDRELEIGPRGVELIDGDLQRGFRLPAAGLTLFSERQLLRRSPFVRRKSSKNKLQTFLGTLRDLKIGDFVVHSEHGIGQFIQLRTLGGPSGPQGLPAELQKAAVPAGGDVEVMEISYADGRRLLLPLSRLDQVQKFSGIEGVAPRLDQLGGSSWNRTKARIKKGLRDMADELLKLYAERAMARAPQMVGHSDLMQQFEAAFEWDETPDQLDAIEAIFDDLAQERPMDRLLCGDVGFGKTEVAMRAALRAVDAGYQVAVLAPTTILADQHLETFERRFHGLPVNIDMISRFRTAQEIKVIQKKVETGQVDILIGTHRLLQRDLKFNKLGLVIVDEEQRFGVAHKERLKQMRKDVHVLAMSATPVPRTLQLSLAGVRDLSLIETPPRDRMAVETAILPFDTRLIREAIDYELQRGGQVYYVYNRVESIEEISHMLRELVPGLKITVGHGQLDEKELARRMHAFVAKEFDLLLATTIIENGIDIPNVNTMIVHNAERYGLAQLYQLRGRVGRSDHLAFCYLLVSADRVLTEDARKRLEAIREFTELGAGFRVAGRDLEIRGAGNMLGAEQSGHINSVGIETYLKLLEETVAELRGQKVEETPSVTLDLPVKMAIPDDYIGDANLRMEIYQRLALSDEPEDKLLAELRDRFGAPPESVATLIKVAALKRLAESLYLQSITARGGKLVLKLRQDARIDPDRLIELIRTKAGYHFSPSGALTVEQVPAHESIERASKLLEFLARPREVVV